MVNRKGAVGLDGTGRTGGQALVLVIMATALVLLAGGASLELGLLARKNSDREVIYRQSYYLARAGIESARALLRERTDLLERVEAGETVDLVPDQIEASFGNGYFDYIRVKPVKKTDEGWILIESRGGCGGGRVTLGRRVLTP